MSRQIVFFLDFIDNCALNLEKICNLLVLNKEFLLLDMRKARFVIMTKREMYLFDMKGLKHGDAIIQEI